MGLTIDCSAGGTTDPAPGYYDITGQQLTITATPDSGYKFEYWDIEGNLNYVPTLTIFVYYELSAYAFFSPIAPPPAPNGKITSMQVKDIARNILYTWTDPSRVWNTTPTVVPGAGNIWIMASATNIGTAIGNLTVKIINASTGVVLATVTVPTAIGGSTGVIWTGDMPNANLQFAASVTP